MDSIRKLVSGKRRRYVNDGYSLDLTYIVPDRIIAMSYPSSGFESMYRNPIGKVSLEPTPKRSGILNYLTLHRVTMS